MCAPFAKICLRSAADLSFSVGPSNRHVSQVLTVGE
jgi:hypothetical protein